VVFALLTTDRGDVVSLLDAEGTPFAAYRYDAWGNPLGEGNLGTGIWTQETTLVSVDLAAQISERQVLRYAGYCYDSESGMYYLSARHYDPETRQFLSKDLSRNDGEQSAYQYCLGNPVGSVDPSGLAPLKLQKKRPSPTDNPLFFQLQAARLAEAREARGTRMKVVAPGNPILLPPDSQTTAVEMTDYLTESWFLPAIGHVKYMVGRHWGFDAVFGVLDDDYQSGYEFAMTSIDDGGYWDATPGWFGPSGTGAVLNIRYHGVDYTANGWCNFSNGALANAFGLPLDVLLAMSLERAIQDARQRIHDKTDFSVWVDPVAEIREAYDHEVYCDWPLMTDGWYFEQEHNLYGQAEPTEDFPRISIDAADFPVY
jgi:RHS repeat-associated protein